MQARLINFFISILLGILFLSALQRVHYVKEKGDLIGESVTNLCVSLVPSFYVSNHVCFTKMADKLQIKNKFMITGKWTE